MTYKKFELIPNRGQKSFYKKAIVTECNGFKLLTSYTTDVAIIDPDGCFRRLWGGYSVTTMKHINAFMALYGIDGGGKADWERRQVEKKRDVIGNNFPVWLVL